MREDPDGELWNIIVGGLIGGAIGFVSNGIQNLAAGKDFCDNWAEATIGGAVSGVVAAATGGMSLLASGAISSAAGSVAEEVVSYSRGKKKLTWSNIGKSALNVGINTVVGTATAGLGGKYARSKYTPIKKPQYRMQIKYNRTVRIKNTVTSVSIGNGLQAGINTVYRVFKPRTAYAYSRWL